MLKISIITVTYNSAKTIETTLNSVANQTYPYIEHIIIDGNSTDTTLKIVDQFSHVAKVVSEPDEGMYDALNKGILMATGDIIGILNSDDFYSNNDIIQGVFDVFNNQQIDAIFGDVIFVDPNNLNKTVRHYSSKKFTPRRFEFGYMPAHPTFFTRKKIYEKYGLFKTDYKICADYELLVRFLYVNKLKFQYLNHIMVTMRTGGISNRNLKQILILNTEIVRACKENGINTNMFKLSFKVFKKLSEFTFVRRFLPNMS
jgi:glycosyltransferase involved in cell wall biosynthesis